MTFFLDLWQDLREKRLWPIAVGLLAAALAIPVVMLKPASEGTPAPVAAVPAPKADTLPAVEVDSSPTHGSKLETFSQRDPFKPLSDLKKADANGSTATAPGSGASDPTASAAGTPVSSGSGSGGSTSTDSTSPSSSPSPITTPGTPSSDTTSTPVKWFRYTADMSFGTPDDLKTLKGVQDFTLLPDPKTAAVVFMGVSNDAKSAIFFIADPAFEASGEGTCNDKQDCRFVKLSLDDKKDQETFTSLDGSVVYKLKLLKLNREYISPDQAQGDTSDSNAGSKLGKDAGGSTIADASQALLPKLVDLPSVASEHRK
jgi:hypothetical protein